MRFLLVTFVLSLFLCLPIVPFADGGLTLSLVEAKGLVPCGGPLPEVPCNACHAMGMVNSLISYMFTIITFLAVMVIMYAGVKLVTSQGNASEWEEAKGMMTNMIVGFVIVLSAWLVVDTLMKMLLSDKVIEPGMWNQLDTKSCDAPLQFNAEDKAAGGTKPAGGGSPAGTGQLSDADARARLEKAGISVNKSIAEGTSLQNINTKTVDDAVALKKACNCEVYFTGGTEAGHGSGDLSHGNGYKYDIRVNDSVNSYITKNYTYSGVRGDGATLYSAPSGSVYAKEGDHWDVLVK
jgi:hypothetical protein